MMKMNIYYMLNGKEVIPCLNVLTWAKWFETADRQIKLDKVGDIFILTIFLGIDHNWSGEGPPLFFETAISGKGPAIIENRYSTYDEALEGHEEIVKRYKGNK